MSLLQSFILKKRKDNIHIGKNFHFFFSKRQNEVVSDFITIKNLLTLQAAESKVSGNRFKHLNEKQVFMIEIVTSSR